MNYDKIEEATNEISGARAILNCIAAAANSGSQPTGKSLEHAIIAVEAALEGTEKKMEDIYKELLEKNV